MSKLLRLSGEKNSAVKSMLEKGETPTALGRACEVRHDGEMAMALSSTDRLLAEQLSFVTE